MTDLDRETLDRPDTGLTTPNDDPVSARGASPARGPAISARPRATARPAADRPRRDDGPLADSLDNYIRSIGSIRVLTREETYELSRTMEAHEAAFRQAMAAIPGTAIRILERWRERQRTGHVTAALSAGYRDGTGRDWGKHIDTELGKLEPMVRRRASAPRASGAKAERRSAALDRRISQALARAGIAIELLLEVYREFQGLRSAPRTRRVADERRRLGLTTPAARADLAKAELALERLHEVKQVFVTHNLKLVLKQARRYRNMGVSYVDLIQEGNLGLIRAVEKFDHRRGFKFSTYAVWWIEQALIRAIQNSSRTVRVPSHIYELQLRYRRVQEELRHQLGRAPRRAELAEALELAPDALERVEASLKPIASTQATLPGTDEFKLEDALTDEDAPDPVDDIDRGEVRRELEQGIAVLDARERQIIEWRYGLSGDDPLTLEQIGRQLGLSRERVRQLEGRALRRLREEGGMERLAASLDLPPDGEPADDDTDRGAAALH